jgi:hypothetical protein
VVTHITERNTTGVLYKVEELGEVVKVLGVAVTTKSKTNELGVWRYRVDGSDNCVI